MYCASGMLWFCPLVPLGLPFRLGAPGKRNGGRAGGEVTRLAQMAWRSLRWPSTPLGCSALRHELGKRREPLPAASSTAQPLAHAVRGLDELLHTLLHLNHLLRHLLHCAATTFAISGHLVTAAGGEGGAGAPSSLRTAEPVAASFERAWSSWPSLLAWVSAICISAPSAPCFWDTCCAFCANQAWYSSATAANATGEISAAASRQGFCQRAVAQGRCGAGAPCSMYLSLPNRPAFSILVSGSNCHRARVTAVPSARAQRWRAGAHLRQAEHGLEVRVIVAGANQRGDAVSMHADDAAARQVVGGLRFRLRRRICRLRLAVPHRDGAPPQRGPPVAAPAGAQLRRRARRRSSSRPSLLLATCSHLPCLTTWLLC